MRSFASAIALLLLAVPLGWAQAPRRPEVPAELAARVAGEVARLWGDDSAAVRLEWGALPPGASFPAGTRFRILGRGESGWLGVVFERPGAGGFAARLHAGADDSAAVAARAIRAGEQLAEADLRVEQRPRWGPPTRGQARAGAGWIARRALAPGDVLSASAAEPAPLVHAGETVQLEWRRGAVIVGLEGIALNSAGLGQPIRVRLTTGGAARNGIVAGPGFARLDS
jgi:flagella basal body P-ring formation protein FlgA